MFIQPYNEFSYHFPTITNISCVPSFQIPGYMHFKNTSPNGIVIITYYMNIRVIIKYVNIYYIWLAVASSSVS